MKKIVVSMVILILTFSMLGEGLLAESRSYYLESGSYDNNCYKQWTVRQSGAYKIRVHFQWIRTESGYDYVETSAGDRWTGHRGGVWSNWANGDTIRITLRSDGSVTDDGFKIDQIEYESSSSSDSTNSTYIPPSSDSIRCSSRSSRYYYLQSGSYDDNWNKQWTIRQSGACRIRVHFVWIRTERGYDYVETSAGDRWTGHLSGVWSDWANGDTIRITLRSDRSVTDDGFKIDRIEYEY
jgi:hypothetical protein